MSVQGINGNHYNPLEVYSTGRSDSASGVNGSEGAGDSPSVVMVEQRGRVSFAIATPELADALNFTPEERQEYLLAAQEKATSAELTLGHKSVMFDIYAVLELIREMSQELRNAMRDMRQLENQAIQSNIKQQAATQKRAAWCQMIGGAVVGVMQGVASVAGLAKQISGLNKQSAVSQQLGADMVDKQLNMAKVGGNQELANSQLAKVEKNMPQTVKLETQLTKADAIARAGDQFDAAKADLAKLEADKATVDDLIKNGKKINPPPAAGDPYEPLSDVEKEAAVNLEQKLDIEIQKQKKVVAAASQEYGELTGEGGAPTERLSHAEEQQAMHKAMLEEVEGYKQGYESALDRANSERRINGKVSAGTQAALEEAGQKYELARARQVAKSSQLETLSPAEHQKQATALSQDLVALSKEAGAQVKTPASERSVAYGMIIQQIANAGGQLGQQVVTGIAQLIQSESTELQADQKQLEEQLDQIKDLFAQDLTVIQKANELFQSVVSKETQSLDEIINALKA